MKKILSLVLCTVMLIGVVPFARTAKSEWVSKIDNIIMSYDFNEYWQCQDWRFSGTQGRDAYDILHTVWEWLDEESYTNKNDNIQTPHMWSFTDMDGKTDAWMTSPEFYVEEEGDNYISFVFNKGGDGYFNMGYFLEEDFANPVFFKNEKVSENWSCNPSYYSPVNAGDYYYSDFDERTFYNYTIIGYCGFKMKIKYKLPDEVKGHNIRFFIRNYKTEFYEKGLSFDDFQVINTVEREYIRNVDISGYGEPWPYATPATVWDLEAMDDSYYPAVIHWYREDGVEPGVFEPGHSYHAEIAVAASDGYAFEYNGKAGLTQFSADGVALNEDTELVDYEKSRVKLINQYESAARLYIVTPTYELPLIEDVILRGVPVAIFGQSADSTPTRVYSADYGKYRIQSATWCKKSGSSYTEFHGRFTADDTYSIKVELVPVGYSTIDEYATVHTALGDATGTRRYDGLYTVYLPDIKCKVASNLKRGTCGDCTWTLDTATGELLVTGSGEFDPGNCWDCDLYEYVDDVKTVIIDEGVTGIASSAFLNWCSLEKAVLADSITEISYDCFPECENLTELKLPSNLQSVGNGSFTNISITELTLPDSLRWLDPGAFSSLSELSSLTLNEGISHIGTWCFSDCPKLNEVTVPATLDYLGENSFGVDYNGVPYDGFTMYVYNGTPASAYARENIDRWATVESLYPPCHIFGSSYPFDPTVAASNRMAFAQTESGEKTYSMTFYTDRALINAPYTVIMLDPDEFELKTDVNGDRYYGYDESYIRISPWDFSVSTVGAGEFTVIFTYKEKCSVELEGSVVYNPGFDCASVYIGGVPQNGFIGGSTSWEPADQMTRGSNGTYSILYKNIPAGEYSFKLYADGDKSKKFVAIDYPSELNKTHEAHLNARGVADNSMKFTLTGTSDVFIVFDLSEYNPDTNRGAKYTIYAAEPEVSAIKYGDVNGDGTVNGQDLVRLRKHLNGISVDLGSGADVTGDGTINGQDLVRLRKYLTTGDGSLLGPKS